MPRKKVNDAPRMLSLCSGIGGIDLAAEWAGWQVAGQCEIDPWCRGILARHWPDVKCVPDIRDVWGDSFDGGPIDLIAGGIPCQPFSVAGKQRGAFDPRHLWPEMRRIAQVFEPTWLLIENVTGFVNLALDDVLNDLEALGYEAGALVLPASAVGAPHQRERVFVMAHAYDHRQPRPQLLNGDATARASAERRRSGQHADADGTAGAMANSARSERRQASRAAGHAPVGDERRRKVKPSQSRLGRASDGLSAGLDGRAGHVHRWPAGPSQAQYDWEAPRTVTERIPDRAKRLHALGNAVVPQQIYPVLRVMYITHMTERAAQEMSL